MHNICFTYEQREHRVATYKAFIHICWMNPHLLLFSYIPILVDRVLEIYYSIFCLCPSLGVGSRLPSHAAVTGCCADRTVSRCLRISRATDRHTVLCVFQVSVTRNEVSVCQMLQELTQSAFVATVVPLCFFESQRSEM